ncbi:putative large intein domain protein [Erwinia phage vB_EamM_Yoloswag]|uniref:Putative large intein domain protein n=1 Tax=Erwinia phage vB_EamM_Yoloswag TaxID=1958956 RepID=A0A1S6L322_9CAUD|nr:putative large intein domain protein [Erwinia phage vB_EamM_Yoloswag]AQT28580.1 putative large intein domain protein [Erwinia phage vB_EamM_Yoloswag]
MARFRVRNKANNGWLDCVDTPMFVRTQEGDWAPLLPDKFSVRNLYGKRWHDIDDSYDPTYDDPCLNLETGECGGGPTSTTKGSGTGDGSGGPTYDQLIGYPPGFDLPDAGRVGFGLLNNYAPPTGRAINRPGIKTFESYDPVGASSRTGLGTYANPNVPYASVHGRGAVITETVFAMPAVEGYVELMFASYVASGMSVDVYHMGVRVASTCGKVAGRSRIKFQFDPDADDMRIMVRVRTEAGAHWSLQVFPPRLVVTSDRGNLALDSQLSYDVINFPDVVHPDYIGTPVFPAPCHASVYPIAARIQDANAFEYYHYIGTVAGWMYLDFTSWETYDFIEVYHSGRRIATTLDAQTANGYLYFLFDPRGSNCYDLMIRVVSKDFGSATSLQSNYYNLYCPSERGAREYRHPCESYTVSSMGHPVTEDCFALGAQTDIRAGLIQVNSGNFATKFEVFDQSMNLLDTEILGANSTGTLEFWKYPEHVLRQNIVVRVTAAIGCDWQYFVYCPVQPPKIDVSDFLVPYRCVVIEGGSAQPPIADDLPWFCYAFDQVDGRGVSGSVANLKAWDGSYMNFWGGSQGWFKFNNSFVKPIKQITFQWVFDGINGAWHDMSIYERYAGEAAAQRVYNSANVMQTITFDTNIPAGEEVWLYAFGGGDRGNSNDVTYLAISNIVFG